MVGKSIFSRVRKLDGVRSFMLSFVLLAGLLVAVVASTAALFAPKFAGTEYQVQVVDDTNVPTAALCAPKPAGIEREPQFMEYTDVPSGKYPFIAALMDVREGDTPFSRQFCGGTLIDKDSVLTAAHCVADAPHRPARVLLVSVGRTSLISDQGVMRRVSAIFVHPDYHDYNKNYTTGHDVAVLKLGRAVSGIAPIKVADANQNVLEKPGRNATVAGWGNIRQRFPDTPQGSCCFPTRMHETQVPLKSDATTRRIYGHEYKPTLLVAAGAGGHGVCQGDSGGPLFARAERSLKPTQIGITSYCAGCAAPGYPGVFTEVSPSSNRNFIMEAARR